MTRMRLVCVESVMQTLFSTVKRRIRNGSNKVETKGRGEKTLSPTFAGSTENLMKEMPLTIAEAALGEMEEDGEDEGFEVYGDEDSVYVFGVCWQ